MTEPASATAAAGPEVAVAPGPAQRAAVKGVLWSVPSLVRGTPLTVLYSRNWTRQASWLCAFGRAAGLDVRLVPVATAANAFEQRLRAATEAGATAFALADMPLDLPADCVQLAGMPAATPLDLWQPDADVAKAARTAASGLRARQVIRTGRASALEFEVTGAGWRADAGARANGQARVSPAGAAVADIAVANGSFVADGAIGLNRPARWDARLAGRPVTITVREGIVTSVECRDDGLRHFLRRAVGVHHAAVVGQARIGVNTRTPGFSTDQGPVNDCHRGVTLTLSVDPPAAYSIASADLRIKLTANAEGGRGDPDAEPVPADR